MQGQESISNMPTSLPLNGNQSYRNWQNNRGGIFVTFTFRILPKNVGLCEMG